MLYYKKIDIDYYDEIIPSCLSYIESKKNIFNRLNNASYYPLDINDFLEKCPLVNISFVKINLVCNFAAAYVSYTNLHNPIHIDNFHHQARINLPILNCENTHTLFYSGGSFLLRNNTETNTSPSVLDRTSYKTLKVVDIVTIDKPTVIRVNEPHRVIMSNTKSPRITFTLGFTEDPIFLLT